MAHLSKLKFSDKQRSQVKMTVEQRLRHKLIDRLTEQTLFNGHFDLRALLVGELELG